MAAITEKQRVSLPIPLWLSLAGIIVTGAGAWFATQARAESTAKETAANTSELKEHDAALREISLTLQELKDAVKHLEKSLERERR